MSVLEAARRVKEASIKMAAAGTELKNSALGRIASKLLENGEAIFEANRRDVERSRSEGLAAPLVKRLVFDAGKLDEVVEGIKSLIALPDPVGRTLSATLLDEGLELYKVTCPIGVMGVIFESRPDALVQISSLCLKSGNAVLLKGGSEARETNRVLADIIVEAAAEAGLPPDWLKLLETRAEVSEMLKLDEYIDLIIPRGSNEFVRYIMDNSRIPVLGHADGICHLYVDEDADLDLAVRVAVDAKTQYVAVCNAVETLLVHEGVAGRFLPVLKSAMEERGVTLLGCPRTREIIPAGPATEEDWRTEYLDYVLSVKVVGGLEEAVEHINTYGSGHTDGIITGDPRRAADFMALVDSGNVFWNCSTRFSDGFRYGLGAEVGISTGKIHARGPVGLEGLVIYKYLLLGNGHVVADYAAKKRSFIHAPLKKDFPLSKI